jgi:hypothetical protein
MKSWHVKFEGNLGKLYRFEYLHLLLNLVKATELRQNLKKIGEYEPHSKDIQRYQCNFEWIWEASGEF